MAKERSERNLLSFFSGRQFLIPLAALLALVLFNLIVDPEFFRVTYGRNSEGYPVLSGNLVSILDDGSELAILAIGMTLVTAASGGQDISAGAVVAICGSVLLRVLCGTGVASGQLQAPIIAAFLVCCLAGILCGAFNGALVAFFRIQPMIATLILFTAGRSVAAWINNNELLRVTDSTFACFGGYIKGIPIPTPVFIAVICFAAVWALLRFTSLGLYVQSVGISEKTSRLNGLDPRIIKVGVFVIMGFCCAVAALIKVSRLSTINYSVIAKDIEMDAILAVALGGNPLSGGKFRMSSSILGAYVIQFLTTTLYKLDVQSDALSAYKAAAVILLVVLSAPAVREKLMKLLRSVTEQKSSADGGRI